MGQVKFANCPMPRTQDGRPPEISDGYNLPGQPGYDPAHRQHRGADWLYRKNHPESPAHWPESTAHYEIEHETPCLAVAAGTVSYAELNYEAWLNAGSPRREDHCTGYVVVLDHGVINGKRYRTAVHHLASTATLVKKNHVAAGQQIGIVGGSPNKSGAKPGTPGMWHVHLDVLEIHAGHVDPPAFDAAHAGRYLNPAPFFHGVKVLAHPTPAWLPDDALAAAAELATRATHFVVG